MEFSTFDADNDQVQYNCAALLGGGFWFSNSDWQNINGHYSGDGYESFQMIWWHVHNNLKKSQLMIRPASGN